MSLSEIKKRTDYINNQPLTIRQSLKDRMADKYFWQFIKNIKS